MKTKRNLPRKIAPVVGELSCHPDGFGFVIPEHEGEDIFIGQRNFKGAMHKDKVVVRIEEDSKRKGSAKGKGRQEGKIIEILERAHKTIIGRFEKTGTSKKCFGIVIPSNKRILQEITIPSPPSFNPSISHLIKGEDHPLFPLSKGGIKGELRGLEGKIVEIEITRWPEEDITPLGKIITILGDHDDPNVEIEVIVRKYGLPHRFPQNVIAEAKEIPQMVEEHSIEERVDLRAKNTITIDGETAKDFDDAVSIEKTHNGYRLWVSIADVAHYVRKGSLLDKEAYTRGTSVYFPDRCVPMLPESLSNGICSLNPNVDRLTLTAEMDFDHNGNILHSKFYESVIKSCERLTYTKVKEILTSRHETQDSRLKQDLLLMEELCLKLKAKRAELGSIDFDLPEPQIIIDIEGRVEDIIKSERNIAHQIVEEFMLAANKSVATYMTGKKLPFLYRVHEKPDEISLHEFKEFVSNFGYTLPSPPFNSPLSKGGDRGVKGGISGVALQHVLAEAEGSAEGRLINHVLLRSMKQAIYSEKNIGHFGLAFEYYTHFTSPIRRYPDLIVHRIMKKVIKKQYSDHDKEYWERALPEITAHTSKRERNAMEAEREIVDLKKCQFMKDKIGEIYNGIISGVTGFGFFVELKDYFVEGLVHVTNMKDDYYVFMEKEHYLIGERRKKRYRIGDNVRVKLTNVDMARRQIDMAISTG